MWAVVREAGVTLLLSENFQDGQTSHPSRCRSLKRSYGRAIVIRYSMHKVLQIFRSFEDAERADEAYYASLAPQQRVDILLDLVARYRETLGDAAAGFERVYRVTELSRS